MGLLDDAYSETAIYEVLCIEPLPHILAEWTKYIPLVLFFPTKIYLYPVDETELAGDLIDFFLDTRGDQTVRDSDHKARYYKQYLKTTDSPKPDTDISYAVDLYNAFLDDSFSLILRGGAPLGQLLAYEPLKYNLNMAFSNNIRGLNESEKDAFFTYRQRMPFEHQDKYGCLAGHPMSALVASYNQLENKENVAALTETAKQLTMAGAVDFMDFYYEQGKKYGNNIMGTEADHIDFDHHPNVMFLRAKQKPGDLVKYAELADIEPFEYLASATVYNPDEVNLYFECPPAIEIGSLEYFEGTNPAGQLTTSHDYEVYLFAKSLTEIGQQVEIKIRYENNTGPIVKQLWVHIFEPRFVNARIHDVRAGQIEVFNEDVEPLIYHEDFDFIASFQVDVSKTAEILRYINLKGPGEITNTFSRYGNIFIVNKKTSADYQSSQSAVSIPVIDAEETGVDNVGVKYIHELNSGADCSVLKINRLMTDPLEVFSTVPVKYTDDFLSIVNFYDQQVSLNIYFTWDLGFSRLIELGIKGLAPPTVIPSIWHEKKSRAIVVEIVEDGSSAEFLSLVLFHEICHKIASYYGTRLWDLPYFVFDADVATLVHPITYHIYGGLDLSVEHENYTFNEEDLLLKDKDLAFLFNLPLGYESSRHQMFPGNIMNPQPGDPNLGGNPDAYEPIISYRLTYKQALLLNEWLKEE
jgi:hypothetical protein